MAHFTVTPRMARCRRSAGSPGERRRFQVGPEGFILMAESFSALVGLGPGAVLRVVPTVSTARHMCVSRHTWLVRRP